MPLDYTLDLVKNTAAIKTALAQLDQGDTPSIVDMPDAARPMLAALAAIHHGGTTLVISSRRDRANQLTSSLREYLPHDVTLERWIAPDALPWEQLQVDLDASVERVRALAQFGFKQKQPRIVVAPVQALMQLLMSPEELKGHSVDLKVGGTVRMDEIARWANQVGYQTVPMVQEPGTIARRGGILDIYPPGFEEPVRLDFFGDEIESIRYFSVHTQRSTGKLNRIRLLPPMELPIWDLLRVGDELKTVDTSTLRPEVLAEWHRHIDHLAQGIVPASIDLFSGYLVPEATTLLDHLPRKTLVILDQPASINLALDQVQQQANELEQTFIASGELPPSLARPYQDATTIRARLQRMQTISIGENLVNDEFHTHALNTLSDPPLYGGNVTELVSDVRDKLQKGWRVSIATDQVNRITEVFADHNVIARRPDENVADATALPVGALEVVPSDLSGGWIWQRGKIAVITDFEIFGYRKQARTLPGKRTASESRAFAASLEVGEHVVHVDHGIARYGGLVRLDYNGMEREYLLLEYQGNDKLYVPVDQSDRVTRYSSGGRLQPQLNKLGSGDWVRTKRKVRKAVRDMAYELIQLYATRQAGHGFQFPPDGKWDIELSESFPFTETPDQMSAIIAVKEDMESFRPMDRLVAGDVGFGKTEVAIRAAFKAVNAGKQVAVLVPTTILALQHYQTFRQRMAAFPVNVQMMSRLRTKKQQAKTLEGMKDGSVDIVIGTHRLVQEDVSFKDVGLIVVDEEQRFGVRQKEFLKSLRTSVDVLSMSATPIPRTLHLSMSGIRDISLIETAPQARLPIRTFVTPFDEQTVREVIMREMDRGGQVYVVHNRVHDIDSFAEHLRKIVPEARFGIGHGQMDENVLEEVMMQFMNHEFDVLIATTIIESGVDIGNVNTMIIDNADTLGLTQLYQLRGRVGRSTNRAYAYLFYQPWKALSEVAQQRLETIQEATELGAGLRVAMRDMEIRGAGNILGAEQSGHIGSVGYELYMRLLTQAVEEARSGQPIIEPGPVTLDLPVTALLPEDYISDTELRLNMYRHIASVQTLEDVDHLVEELKDRFGDYPEEVEHLLALIRLRIRAVELGIDSIVERERVLVIRGIDTRAIDQKRIERELGRAVKFTPNSIRIQATGLTMAWRTALDLVISELERSLSVAA
ncbi:MAG: transcription-repair coupling factor [Thermomicrobiales bacterium]|nr:transcription-repair coupling factor [Thermomicrobiales bacterium]